MVGAHALGARGCGRAGSNPPPPPLNPLFQFGIGCSRVNIPFLIPRLRSAISVETCRDVMNRHDEPVARNRSPKCALGARNAH